MNPIFWQIVVGIILTALGALVNIWVIRAARREKIPEDVSVLTARLEFQAERISEMNEHLDLSSRDMSVIRDRLMRIETKLNGSAWKPGGING